MGTGPTVKTGRNNGLMLKQVVFHLPSDTTTVQLFYFNHNITGDYSE